MHRRNKPVATDTIYCNVPAIDDGSMCAQFYVDLHTKYCNAFGVKTDGDFSKTLMDVIQKHGAMDQLISERSGSSLEESS